MKFAHPYLLNLLWLLILVLGIIAYGMLKRKKIMAAFADTNMLSSIAPGFNPKRRWVKACLIVLAASFAIVALAAPRAGFRWEKVEQKGVDIMIALDCSKSMLAQDIKPSRLARAKYEIIDLLRMMKSDRAGLVAFSGRAILQCPLTLDREAFNIFLNVLEPGFLPVGGTNLDEAIKTSYEGFEKDSDTQKAIILITDGEITSGSIENTAKEMAKLGVKIFCIGVGDLEGAPIPDDKGGFKKDGSGNIILSKVDEKGLKKISSITGGAYVRSVAGDMDLDLIYTDKILGTMDRRTLTSGKKKVWENRYQWFLFPCILLLLIELLLPSKRQKKKRANQRKNQQSNRLPIFVLAVLVGTSVFNSNIARAKMVSSSVKEGILAFDAQEYEKAKKYFIDAQLENPENETLYYNIGSAAYMNKDFEQAEKNFMQASETKNLELKHNALYNLANTRYRLGKMEEAIKGYKGLLTQFPEDTQARENLEFVKKKKEQQQQKKKEDQKKQEKNDKKNQDTNKSDQKKQDQKKQDQKKQDQKKQDQKKQDQKKQDQKKQDQKKQDQKKQDQDKEKQQAKPSDSEQQKAKSDRALPGQNIESKLNRLEDKPGRAMMPVVRKHNIEKDW
ncbi:MAG: VWA domain-containing protein [Desulfobacula sp.]|nr:VWA domain-containing protein [Desulfobacula sp.]